MVIHNTKGKTSVDVLVSNYSNKHITFNKGEYIGHLEQVLEDTEGTNIPFHEHTDGHSANSVITQWMMAEQIEPDTFDPSTPCPEVKHQNETTSSIKRICISICQG